MPACMHAACPPRHYSPRPPLALGSNWGPAAGAASVLPRCRHLNRPGSQQPAAPAAHPGARPPRSAGRGSCCRAQRATAANHNSRCTQSRTVCCCPVAGVAADRLLPCTAGLLHAGLMHELCTWPHSQPTPTPAQGLMRCTAAGLSSPFPLLRSPPALLPPPPGSKKDSRDAQQQVCHRLPHTGGAVPHERRQLRQRPLQAVKAVKGQSKQS